MMRIAKAELGTRSANTIMVGDTMETDILGGVQMGFKTVLTLTGSTSLEDLESYAYRPDHIITSIQELNDPMVMEKIIHGELVLQ